MMQAIKQLIYAIYASFLLDILYIYKLYEELGNIIVTLCNKIRKMLPIICSIKGL